MNYGLIESKLNELLDTAESFSDFEKKEVCEFVLVAEYGLALLTFVDIAMEERKRLTPDAILLCIDLFSLMNMHESDEFKKFDQWSDGVGID